jgi:cold shock CspA family protein
MLGTVVMFDRERGFGFIKPHREKRVQGGDFFVHVSAFDRDDEGEYPMLVIGDEIEFEAVESPKGNGRQAVNCALRRRSRHFADSEVA